jgi:hypothetical protein
METSKPQDLTTDQKLEIRDMQLEMANIAIQQAQIVKAFDELKKKHSDVEEKMKQYSSTLASEKQLEKWALSEKLEWVEKV